VFAGSGAELMFPDLSWGEAAWYQRIATMPKVLVVRDDGDLLTQLQQWYAPVSLAGSSVSNERLH
jgi:hypothetical protein